LLDDTITAVYLGRRVTDDMKDDVIFEIKRKFPNAKIFSGKASKGDFALNFEQVL